MFRSALFGIALAQCLHWAKLAQGHVVLTYPAWRGNNLITDDSFPFGMQWAYPCGGLGVTTNRTHWPLDGGAVAFQPGWFVGHDTALIYINIGLGEQPSNYSWPITTLYIDGPTNGPYPGTVCLPKLTLPAEVRRQIKSGDFASIQVIEAAKHGAGLFTCADIIFTEDNDEVPNVSERNCFNSSDIKVSDVAILGSQELPSACASLTSGSTGTTAAAPSNSGDLWGWACDNNNRSEVFNGSGSAQCPSSTSSPPADKNGAHGAREGGKGAMTAVSVVLAAFILSASF